MAGFRTRSKMKFIFIDKFDLFYVKPPKNPMKVILTGLIEPWLSENQKGKCFESWQYWFVFV